jgi:PAS domain S-box-containing protein
VLSWTGRAAQYLGGAYMLIAAFASVRESHAWRISLEAALREERDFSAAVLDTAGALVVVLDTQGRITRFNRACERLTGYPAPDVLGRVFWEFLIPPEDTAAVMEAWKAIDPIRGPIRHENHWLTREGTRRLIDWSNTALPGEAGEVRHIIAIGIDITERKQAEEALRESRAKLEAAFASMTEAIFIADAQGRLIDFNDEFVRYHRFQNRQECSTTIADCPRYLDVYFEDGTPAPPERWAMARALRGETASNIEYMLRRKDTGETWWGSYNFGPIKDNNGRIVGAIVAGREITERKRAEKALRESEEHYRLLFNSMMEMFLIVEPVYDQEGRPIDYTFLDVNPAYERFVGTPRDQLVGRSAKRVFRVVEDYWVELFARVAKTGEPAHYEDYGVEHGRTYELRAWRTGENQVAFIVDDVSERKRAEEALKKSEERFRSVFTSNVAALGIWDAQGRLLDANDRFLELIGYTRAAFEAGQVRWDEATPPEMRQRDYDAVQELQAGRKIKPYEKEFVRPDGTRVPVIIGGSILPGTPDIGVAFAVDISDRKQAEESLRRITEELQAVMEAVPTAIFISRDPECRTIIGNRAAREIVALPPNANLSKSAPEEERPTQWQEMREGVPIAPEDLPLQQAARGKEIRDYKMDLVFQDGTVKSILGQAMPLKNQEGKPQGGVAVLLDITAIKKAEETLRELNATLESKVAQRTVELQQRAKQLQKLALELSQAEERERRRIAVILHEDLQQQIAGAKFHLSLVRNRVQDDRLRTDVAQVDELLKEAIEKSRTLSRDLSPAVLHMNDLAELLQWLANQVRGQQGLNVTVEVRGDMMLQSEALATFLFRAAQEMLFNIVKHAHVRAAAIRVRRIGRYAGVSVSDRGCGFDPQELKETSGIGLFSIRERTELLGGRLKVKSAKGQGSRFSIVVPDSPKVKKGETATENVAHACAPASSPSAHGAVRVLVVDDHDIVRDGLAAMLREAPGIEVVGEAPDGREAINKALALHPDVVLMDVSMPLLSGEEATRQIKTRLPKTRVIALSMYDEAEKKEKMFEAGAEGYILKTVSAEDLIAAIRGKE